MKCAWMLVATAMLAAVLVGCEKPEAPERVQAFDETKDPVSPLPMPVADSGLLNPPRVEAVQPVPPAPEAPQAPRPPADEPTTETPAEEPQTPAAPEPPAATPDRQPVSPVPLAPMGPDDNW